MTLLPELATTRCYQNGVARCARVSPDRTETRDGEIIRKVSDRVTNGYVRRLTASARSDPSSHALRKKRKKRCAMRGLSTQGDEGENCVPSLGARAIA